MEGGEVEWQVGGVHHVLYRCPTTYHHHLPTLHKKVLERGGCRDGRVFPYLAHYLATGDMLYPEHEGEVMVGRLLQELTRLDLVNDLLHAHKPPLAALTSCLPRLHHLTPSEGGTGVKWEEDGGVGKGKSGTLKVHTRRRPRLSFPALLTHLFPAHTSPHAPPVYRPQPNKGTTLVMVSRRGDAEGGGVEVHAAPGVLHALFPTQVAHPHASNAHIQTTRTRLAKPPHLLLKTLADKGYFPTVRSWWVCEVTGALVTQWVVYRKGRRRNKSGTKSSTSSTLSSLSSTIRRASSTSHLSFISHLSSSSSSSSHLSSSSSSSHLSVSAPSSSDGSEGGREETWREGKGRKKGGQIVREKAEEEGARGYGRATEEEEEKKEREEWRREEGGTLRNRLRTRSKSIISLATDHSTRPALTLKRLLNALL